MKTSAPMFATWMSDELRSIATSLETHELDTLWEDFGQQRDYEWWSHGMRHVHRLGAADAVRINEIVRSAVTRREFIGLEAEAVRELLIDIVADLADGDRNAQDVPTHLISVLQESIKPRWHVVPLSGIAVESTHHVGPVSILPDLETLRALLLSDASDLDLSRAEPHIAAVGERPAFAAVRLQGDEKYVKHRGYDMVEDALDVFRCFGPLLLGVRSERLEILQGVERTSASLMSIGVGPDGAEWSTSLRPDASISLDLTTARLRAVRQLNWRVFETVLKAVGDRMERFAVGAPTSRQHFGGEALAAAVHWIARANESARPIDVVLYSVVSMEALTAAGDGREGLADRVAERSARLLSDDPMQQRALFDDIKSLYMSRSQAVHGRRLRLESSRAEQAKILALELLLSFVKLELHTFSDEDACEWFMVRRFRLPDGS